jgi:haloalkane dehalogenase
MEAMPTAGDLAYREAGAADDPPVLLLHGYPETSYMWRDLLPALAAQGRRALAPDLAGFGDSKPDPPSTWERHVESIERFRTAAGLERVALVVHDWGGLIGLAWACEHPEAVSALVISGTGFFSDGKWHGMAQALRTEGAGEEIMRTLDRAAFAGMLGQASTGIGDDALDEYWKSYEGDVRRSGQLELYRSLDFEKLARYHGGLAELGVPVLLLWGADDPFAPVAGAHRFERELPDTELVVIEDAGHFVFEDAPERCADAVTRFLAPT